MRSCVAMKLPGRQNWSRVFGKSRREKCDGEVAGTGTRFRRVIRLGKVGRHARWEEAGGRREMRNVQETGRPGTKEGEGAVRGSQAAGGRRGGWLRLAGCGRGRLARYLWPDCEGKRVHVSEICPVGGAVVFMRARHRPIRRPAVDCPYRGSRKGWEKNSVGRGGWGAAESVVGARPTPHLAPRHLCTHASNQISETEAGRGWESFEESTLLRQLTVRVSHNEPYDNRLGA